VVVHIKKGAGALCRVLKDVVETERIHAEPVVSGYPGPVRITVAEDSVRSSEGSLRIENLVMSAWPLPWAAVHVKTGTLTVHSHKWSQPLAFDSLEAWVGYNGRKIKIHDSYLNSRDFEGSAKGTIDLRQEPVPKVEMNVLLTNFSPFIGHLAELGILKHNEALFTNAGLSLMASGSNQVVCRLPRMARRFMRGLYRWRPFLLHAPRRNIIGLTKLNNLAADMPRVAEEVEQEFPIAFTNCFLHCR
jgi:hypothetical protein